MVNSNPPGTAKPDERFGSGLSSPPLNDDAPFDDNYTHREPPLLHHHRQHHDQQFVHSDQPQYHDASMPAEYDAHLSSSASPTNSMVAADAGDRHLQQQPPHRHQHQHQHHHRHHQRHRGQRDYGADVETTAAAASSAVAAVGVVGADDSMPSQQFFGSVEPSTMHSVPSNNQFQTAADTDGGSSSMRPGSGTVQIVQPPVGSQSSRQSSYIVSTEVATTAIRCICLCCHDAFLCLVVCEQKKTCATRAPPLSLSLSLL